MDLTILKKKLSTYRTEGGYLKNVSNELLVEILAAWEEWTGPASGFYKSLGTDHNRMASMMGKAKKLKREGVVAEGFSSDFKEVKIAQENDNTKLNGAIVINWNKKTQIQFNQVDHLIDFLNKVEAKKAA